MAAAMKHMASNFAKLDKFHGVDFRRWQKKMHFLLSSMSVVYVLTTPIPEDGKNATMEQIRKRNKWDNDDYVCRGLILNVVRLSDPQLKTLGERDIECIFVGYAEHFKAFRFSSVHRPSQRSLINETEDIGGSVVLKEVTKEVMAQQPKPDLRKSKRNKTSKNFGPEFSIILNCRNKGREAINDEMDSILGNNTWMLADLPPVIDYFDTYAPVARISTIRLLIAMASIHNMIIYQMDVKTSFLNGELDEEQAPKKWHQKFDEVVLYIGYLLNQADKCVYSKFDESCKGVIICLYVDDMMIFGTDQVQVDLTKELLSSKFSMKDMREVDVILGITIKHEMSTPMEVSENLIPNNGQAVSQLEYSMVIGYMMYAITCTRPDIAFTVGKLSRYTSNPGTQHWQAIQQISNTEDNSSTSGWVFLLGGGEISWASKKQTCITSSTMESEFVALATTGKEAE
ncbi:zinc finger, CCHC-type containing protein [Tanacetum coccineum]